MDVLCHPGDVNAVQQVARKARWWMETRRVASLPSLAPTTRGTALLSYVTEPFFAGDGAIPTGHTHFWESWRMARTLQELGFAVDAISYHNTRFRPRRSYDVVVDVRWNLERLAPTLGAQCLKLAHLDTASLAYQAAAEQRRLDELRERRGVTLQPRRFEPPNRAAEVADAATVIGNAWTLSTYAGVQTPLHRVPVTSTATWDEFPARDFTAARRSFLWLGSSGMVHKGLDLVLEVFAARPELSLTVCGPVAAEADFAAAYRTELYETPNIRTVDWVDVASPAFDAIIRECAALIYPSCSEGSSGAVACAMHAGLVPLISQESGIDVSAEEGVVLPTSRLADIEAVVSEFADRDPQDIEAAARAAWAAARRRHSRAAFTARYRATLERLLAERLM